MSNLCFILTLNCKSREEHFPNKCPFDLHFECHNILTTLATHVVKAVFDKTLNYLFLHSCDIPLVFLAYRFDEVPSRCSTRFISWNKITVIK